MTQTFFNIFIPFKREKVYFPSEVTTGVGLLNNSLCYFARWLAFTTRVYL